MSPEAGPAKARENTEEQTRTIDFTGLSKGTTSIGPYRLIRQLGEGGMGVVYQAQQLQPICRDVALKIIKPGMDSKQVIARFESERQALAIMDHVNIARVYEAGATASELPYFVMELVDGIPITRYCDSKRLTVRERIEIFIPVCKAIQHAHQKGILHRDIKPSNILVTEQDGKPVPKVIDFGLAKALGHQLSEATLMTNVGTIVGTLQYMSPEQAELSRHDVDTRSDIYSLGVVLYELMTGTTPVDRELVIKSAYLEVLRSIREQEPPTPSDRMRRSAESAEIAAQRRTDPAHLPKLLHGELDWITMKALEKDRTRRFETANGLARDLQRYLDGQPVDSAPPSVAYRAGKFVRRHRVWLAAATTALLAICIGAGVAIFQARIAQQRFNDVRRLANTFLFDFEQEIRDVPGTVKAREMIVSTALDYLNRLSAFASRDPGLQWELATAYHKALLAKDSNDRATKNDIGEMEERLASTLMNVDPRRALQHAHRAALLLDAASPDKLEDRALPRITIAFSYITLGQLRDVERSLNEADGVLKTASANPVRADVEAFLDLAWARLETAQGHRSAAEQRFQRAIALQEDLFRKAPTPRNACPLALTLGYAAAAIPEAGSKYRARIAALWKDQNQRFPHSSFIEHQLAEAQAKLAQGMADPVAIHERRAAK